MTMTQTLLLAVQAAIVAIQELTDRKPDDAVDAIPLKSIISHPEMRIIQCGCKAVHLSKLLFTIMERLINSSDGTLDFIDSCIDETCICPWRNGQQTELSSRRCVACRLSTKLWEANIPYKVIYSQTTNLFRLVACPEQDCEIKIVSTTNHDFFAAERVRRVRKLVKHLNFLIPVLQKYETHELAEGRDTILPILTGLANMKSRYPS